MFYERKLGLKTLRVPFVIHYSLHLWSKGRLSRDFGFESFLRLVIHSSGLLVIESVSDPIQIWTLLTLVCLENRVQLKGNDELKFYSCHDIYSYISNSP